MHKEHETQEKKHKEHETHKQLNYKTKQKKKTRPSYSLALFCKKAKSFFMKLSFFSTWH